MRHGGKILIDQLEKQGVTAAFTVPGESFLAALDGLFDSKQIKTIICRQEGGASMMAEAWGKMTGKPGICFVTRGPGAANAMSGLHVAQQDSTPMILFLGLPGERHEDREAFQEIDTKRLFSSFVKWAAVIRSIDRIPEYVSRAFHVASSGRPGPVVLGLPEDMLSARAEAKDARPVRFAAAAPSPVVIAEFADLLASAQRPLMIIGGPGWSTTVEARIKSFAERFDLPVAAAFRFQDYMDNRHPCYVGHAGIGIDPKLAAAVKDADLLIVVGARLGEMTTSGYTLIDIPNPSQKLVHIHPSPDELGTVYAPDLPITSTAEGFAAALDALQRPANIPWRQRRAELRAAYEATLEPIPTPGDVQLGQVVHTLSEMLPPEAIVANGAGNYASFVHRYFQYKGYRTQLAPTSGSMGYGLPAAIAAKLAEPERPVVAFAGDGCFMMTSQELATAVQYGLNVVTIVCNNGIYGTIRMHQEKKYPDRVVGTSLVNPDFAAFARSFGAHGETVQRTEEFRPAFERALASGKPAVIELKIDPEAITPRQSLSQIRGTGVKD
ncbi:MAG: thiamine pyrophosphate-binding protein [Proteobacteria bacterium]|jgi:acetolactate synthase-1/2/3 large subunit|nr:MAG: thiamine pyrophosphate-binding protein [Pseudomonadota bacterium]